MVHCIHVMGPANNFLGIILHLRKATYMKPNKYALVHFLKRCRIIPLFKVKI